MSGVKRWTGPADIAWCDEHGLHGARDRCFDCRKPVEQIRMLPLDELRAYLDVQDLGADACYASPAELMPVTASYARPEGIDRG